VATYIHKELPDDKSEIFFTKVSVAASEWARWALAHPEFGSSVNPITTRGADYSHYITASPPGFENPAASLKVNQFLLFHMFFFITFVFALTFSL
jgi:hypothetical protein